MADGPDPLGKRALFWMPVEAEAEVDPSVAVPSQRADTGHRSDGGLPHARPAGRRALFSDAIPADEPEGEWSTVTTSDPLPPKGILAVTCSTCGSVSRVGVIEFVMLQLPVGAWLPRRTFDRWMTCPSCRRRTWTSVTIRR